MTGPSRCAVAIRSPTIAASMPSNGGRIAAAAGAAHNRDRRCRAGAVTDPGSRRLRLWSAMMRYRVVFVVAGDVGTRDLATVSMTG